MKCLFCGTDNPSEAVFCKKCGRRLDGMAVCQHCGNLTPADGEFCIHCGSNRNAPVYTFKATTSGVATPKPEKNKMEKHYSSTISARPKTKDTKVAKILELVSFISYCIVLLSSLVFTFLIGANVQLGAGGSSADFPGLEDFTLFYYFGKAFDSLNGNDLAAYGSLGPVLGLVSVILTLVGILVVTGFAIRAIVLYVQKKEDSITKFATISYFVFLAGVVLFMLNIASSTTVATGQVGISMAMAINGPSLAGIIVGGIFLLAAIVLDAINKGVVGTLKSYLSQGILGGILAILGIVTLSFIGHEVIATSNEIVGNGYGFLAFSNTLFQRAIATYPLASDTWNEFVGNFVGSLIFLIGILVFALAFLTFLVLMVKDTLACFGYGFDGKAARHGIFAGIAAVLVGVFELLLGLCFAPYFFGETVEVSVVTPVLFIVFGILILAGSITARILCPHKEEEPVIEAESKTEASTAEN